jgi:hypothetical protein
MSAATRPSGVEIEAATRTDPGPDYRAALAARNAAAQARWFADYRRRLAGAPSWWFDREYVTAVALEMLPAVAADLGFTLACATWGPGDLRWWPPAEPGRVIMLADAERRAVFIDRASGYWIVGAFERRGADLVGLAAFRWQIDDARAAWRLARICGLRRPHA